MKLFIILRKELLDQIRDKRTMIAAILMPAVIVPALLYLMMQATWNEKADEPIRIALQAEDTRLADMVRLSFPDAQFELVASPSESIRTGAAELGIAAEKTDGEYSSITLYYDSARMASGLAHGNLYGLLSATFSPPVVTTNDVKLVSATIRSGDESKALQLLSILLPVFLVLFAASSSISSVIDLSAGEKERGTIETLLCCDISHWSILIGKTIAAAVIGYSSVVSLFLGLLVGSELFPGITGGVSLRAVVGMANVGWMLLAALGAVLLFSSAGIAIGLYAKSVKEGTILTLPVIILSSALSSGFIGGDPFLIKTYFYFIPILNLSSIIRSLVFSYRNVGVLLVSILVNLAWSALFLLLSDRLLKKETVISRS